jgi:ubiquinol-cytochrome c reductase cytochrome c1 subunit
MKNFTLKALAASALVLSSWLVPAHSAGEAKHPAVMDWSFNGPFGTFDRDGLRRGFQVYKEVCASCHGLSQVSFRNLSQEGGPEFSEAEVKAIAAEYSV